MGHEGMPPHVQVLQMMMGHWVAQVLGTLAELGIADALASGPRDANALAPKAKCDPDALHRLLRAAAAVGLLSESEGQGFALTPLGECLRSDSPAGLRDLIVAELAPGHWLPWGRLRDAIRSGKPQAQEALGTDAWTYYAKHPSEGAWFARGMGNLSRIAAAEVTTAYDFSGYARIVDVGGSQGALLAAILAKAPTSRGLLFDRPEVIEEAQATIAGYRLGDRIATEAGDFFEHVPEGADAYVLKAILHDWDDARATAILRTVARATRPGAKVLIVEMLLGEHPAATTVKLMDINMLVMLGGRERTVDDYRALLSAAGLTLTKVVPTQGLFAVLEATR